MSVTSLEHNNLILKCYFKYHKASNYRCYRLGVFLSNVPKDRKVFPKQRICLKDHPPRLEHSAPTQLCNCELKICLGRYGYGFCRMPLAVWSLWHSSLGSLDGSSPLTKSATCGVPWQTQSFQNLMIYVYWIHQINLY